MAARCRRYANLRSDKTSDCKVEYGVCLSAVTGGVFGEARVGVFSQSLKKHYSGRGTIGEDFSISLSVSGVFLETERDLILSHVKKI